MAAHSRSAKKVWRMRWLVESDCKIGSDPILDVHNYKCNTLCLTQFHFMTVIQPTHGGHWMCSNRGNKTQLLVASRL